MLLFESRLAAAERHIERLEALAVHSRGRSGQGYAGRGELERAELELTRAHEQFSMEKGALIEAKMQFRELLDQDPEELELPTLQRLTEHLRAPEELEAAVLDAPLFRQANEGVEVAQAQHKESRASLKPQLNLEGSLQRREIGGRMEEDAVIALRLRMDVFQGFSNFRRVEAAGRRIEAARWSQRATRRDLRRELNTLIEQDEVLGWRLDSLEAQLSNAKQVAEAYQEQFEVGMREIDDLLPLQRDLFEVERQLSELESQQIRIQYRVATKLGWLGKLLDEGVQETS